MEEAHRCQSSLTNKIASSTNPAGSKWEQARKLLSWNVWDCSTTQNKSAEHYYFVPWLSSFEWLHSKRTKQAPFLDGFRATIDRHFSYLLQYALPLFTYTCCKGGAHKYEMESLLSHAGPPSLDFDILESANNLSGVGMVRLGRQWRNCRVFDQNPYDVGSVSHASSGYQTTAIT